MILYLYALADGLDDVSGVTGVQNEELVLLQLPEAICVAGWMLHAPSLTRESLAAQDRVVRALHARAAALLPMRFGAAMPDAAAVERALHIQGTGLRARLTAVRGREQMTIRVLGARGARGASGTSATGTGAASATSASGAGAIGAAGGTLAGGLPAEAASGLPAEAAVAAKAGDTAAKAGTRYLQARAAMASPPELAPLLDALKPLQRATRVQASRHPGVIATVYQLVERGSGEQYRTAAEAAASQLHGITIRVSGPAPASAFATTSASRAAPDPD